jgi:DNA-binding IclR family transcriptional regulator
VSEAPQHRRIGWIVAPAPQSARNGAMAQPRGIQAIGIGFGVLDCLASVRKPMPLKAIAGATGMTPSKLRFYLVSFLELGLVSQDPLSGRYSLGPHAVKLGLAALEQFDVITASQRELHGLVEALGYSAFLAVWGNHGPSVVFRVDGPKKTVLEIRVGSVLPLLNSAIGRVFLTFMPRSATDRILRAEIDASRTGTTRRARASRAHAEQIVKRTRSAGVAVARGTLLTGFTAVAAPIMDHAGLPAAAISIVGPIGSLDDNVTGRPARLLAAVAASLSEQIGGSPIGARTGRFAARKSQR